MTHNIQVEFHTNVDAYSGKSCWPQYLPVVPRVGEFVNVRNDLKPYFQIKHLPIRMEVVSVTYQERSDPTTHIAFVELWYNSTDKQLAEMAGGITL